MDPLSSVLSLLKLRSYVSGGFDASGEWAVQFGAYEGIKFHIVLNGACWVVIDGEAEPVQIRAGECFLQTQGKPFRLASDLAAAPVELSTLLPASPDGRIVRYHQGGEFLSLGGYFELAHSQAAHLLNQLPAIIHIRNQSGLSTLHWCIERMRQELATPQLGDFIVAQQLATLVLVEALRAYLASSPQQRRGWLYALSDPQLAAAINAIHHSPGQPWSVQSMAEQAAMSRTAFSVRFKHKVGLSPMDYLTRWRMQLAGEELTHTRKSIAVIAFELGYQSEKSFSSAFKRVMNHSPRQYARLASQRGE